MWRRGCTWPLWAGHAGKASQASLASGLLLFFVVVVVLIFEAVSCSPAWFQTDWVAKGDFELLILLPLTPECWNDSCVTAPGLFGAGGRMEPRMSALHSKLYPSQGLMG